MNKKLVSLVLMAMIVNGLYAQQSGGTCEQKMKAIQLYSETNLYTLENYIADYQTILSCAEDGNPEAQFMMGMMYADQNAITYDKKKSETYLIKAAHQGHEKALFSLGLMYQHGQEQEIDYTKAKSWYTEAYNSGSQEAAYALGYLYLKGLGTIQQDYTKAITWLEKSSYPMAKHWLGVCYYFGYGVTQDTEKAIAILSNNPIQNSATLLEALTTADKKSNRIRQKNKDTFIKQQLIPTKYPTITTTAHPSQLAGKWEGILLIYDYSGETITQRVPLYLDFSDFDANDNVSYTIKLENQEVTGTANWSDHAIVFNKLKYLLDQPYTDDPLRTKLTYSLRSMKLAQKQEGNTAYLIGTLATRITEYGEPGAPTAIVIKKQKNILQTLGSEILQVYPNPVLDKVHIGYTIQKAQAVNIKIYNTLGILIKTIDNNSTTILGKTEHTISLKEQPDGIYFIHVAIGGQTYMQTIIKANIKNQ